MPKWGRNDQAVTANSTTTKESTNGAPTGVWAMVMKGAEAVATSSTNAHFGNTSAGSRANVDSNLFGNVTMGAFIPNMATGVFGVSYTMMGIVDGSLATADLGFAGSGYFANATVAITAPNGGSSGVVNAHANATTGKIDALNISTPGTAYKDPVTIVIATATAQTFNSNTAVFSAQTINSNSALQNAQTFKANSQGVVANAILLASQPYSVNDALTYTVSAGNTAVVPLVNGHVYFTVVANTTAVVLALTPNGAQIALTSGVNESGHTLTRYNFVAIATNPFGNNTLLKYAVAASNTAISPLVNATSYFAVLANSSGLSLSNTSGGPVVNLVPGLTETGHTLTRNNFIAIGSSVYQNRDLLTYTVAAGNTAISPLVNAATYYVTGSNTTGIFLAANIAAFNTNTVIQLVPGVTEAGHTLQGQRATGAVTAGGQPHHQGVSHAGWVLRREGTGGRAGRVTYETLVAMGSLGAQSASYGTPALVANAAGTSNTLFPSAN